MGEKLCNAKCLRKSFVVKDNLAFIKTYFETLSISMKKLEAIRMLLTDFTQLLSNLEHNLSSISGNVGEKK